MREEKNIYVGNRYVPKIMGEWNKQETYEGLSIVTHEGTSYTSKKGVPIGVDISNETYWVVTGNYNAQIEKYRKDVNDLYKNTKEEFKKVIYHFDTVEQMINSDLPIGSYCSTKGFYNALDGGGADYIVKSNTTTANGMDKLQSTNNNVFEMNMKNDEINIKQLGAKAVKGFDNSEIILRAVELSTLINIPAGSFECSVDLTKIKRKSVIFKGMTSLMQWGEDDRPFSQLVFNGKENEYIIKNHIWTDGDPSSISIQNLSFNGNEKKGNGVMAGDSSFINQCEFIQCNKGITNIRMGSVTQTVIKKCKAGIEKLTDSRISDSMFHHCDVGINAIYSNSNVYTNNKIEWNKTGMVLKNAVFNNISSGNTFDRNTDYGLKVSESTHITVVGNTFERNLIHEIYLSGSQVLINGNFFIRKNTEDDQTGEMKPDIHIRFDSIANAQVTGNAFNGGKEFYGTTEYTDKVIIEDNTLDGIGEEVNATIPETLVPAGQTVSINVPYPTDFYDTTNNGSDYIVLYTQIRRGGNSFPRIYSSSDYKVEQYQENLLIRYTNAGSADVTVGGHIRLKQTNWNKR